MHIRKLASVWEACFRFGLTRPGFVNLLVVLSGWTLTQGPHAITASLVAAGVAERRHWEAFHRFFSRGAWSPDQLGRNLFARLESHVGEVLRLAIDDTMTAKKGPQIFGIGSHLDAVRSTKKRKVFAFGHVWVVLAVLVRVPFSSRTWALPVLFRLYRNEKDCTAKGHPFKKKTELARDMLDVMATWTKAPRIEVALDSAYCNDTVSRDLPERFVLFGSMRPDAVLTAPPEHQGKGGLGRPAIRGKTLRKPEQLAADGRTPWKEATAQLYGKTTVVRYKTMVAQWYRATGPRLLRIVVVDCPTGAIPFRVFFSSDALIDIPLLLETYAGRWAIEVFFREAKQLLGFADSQARKKVAVERVAPMVGLLYASLVIWFAEHTHATAIALPPVRPWYPHEKGLCFADILRAAQRALTAQDILDLANDSNNLQEPRPSASASAKPPRKPPVRVRPIAA